MLSRSAPPRLRLGVGPCRRSPRSAPGRGRSLRYIVGLCAAACRRRASAFCLLSSLSGCSGASSERRTGRVHFTVASIVPAPCARVSPVRLVGDVLVFFRVEHPSGDSYAPVDSADHLLARRMLAHIGLQCPYRDPLLPRRHAPFVVLPAKTAVVYSRHRCCLRAPPMRNRPACSRHRHRRRAVLRSILVSDSFMSASSIQGRGRLRAVSSFWTSAPRGGVQRQISPIPSRRIRDTTPAVSPSYDVLLSMSKSDRCLAPLLRRATEADETCRAQAALRSPLSLADRCRRSRAANAVAVARIRIAECCHPQTGVPPASACGGGFVGPGYGARRRPGDFARAACKRQAAKANRRRLGVEGMLSDVRG